MNTKPFIHKNMTQCKRKTAGWLLLCLFLFIFNSCQNRDKEDGFISIFDGKTLSGWTGDSTYWRVENGTLVGIVTPETILKRNSFIIWQDGAPEDFELKLEYRITKKGNSGINYRSEEIDSIPFALRGYQLDLDGNNRYTGQNYEERVRTTLAYRGQRVMLEPLPDSLRAMPKSAFIKNNAWTRAVLIDSLGNPEELGHAIKEDDWNSCYLVAKGNKMQHYVNDILMSEVIDNDLQNRKMNGRIGVQVHVGPPMKVEFRNIRLKVYK
jgi:hypothetical protein